MFQVVLAVFGGFSFSTFLLSFLYFHPFKSFGNFFINIQFHKKAIIEFVFFDAK